MAASQSAGRAGVRGVGLEGALTGQPIMADTLIRAECRVQAQPPHSHYGPPPGAIPPPPPGPPPPRGEAQQQTPPRHWTHSLTHWLTDTPHAAQPCCLPA